MRPLRLRQMHLTVDHVVRATRPVEDVTYPSSFTRASDQDYASLVDRLTGEKPYGPLHIFAYGSLIWKPTFEPVATRHAVARGWHRQFCTQIRGHRGFGRAVALRPDAWADFTISEGLGAHRAMAFFCRLDELANQPGDQFTEMDDALDTAAPELIPECLEALHAARVASLPPTQPSQASHKPVGRNDPCPCGSGKKFKKCCLH